MKKFKQIITVVALAMFMLSSFSGNAQSLSSKKNPIHIDVKFGYAAGPFGCVGWSLCSITINAKHNSPSKNAATGTLSLTKGGEIVMHVKYADMDAVSKKNLFSNKKTFKVEDDFYIDREVSSKMGAKEKQLIIKKGEYSIKYLKDGIDILYK